MLDCESRSTANNAGWREDRQWARALDHGWNLGEAKQVWADTSLLRSALPESKSLYRVVAPAAHVDNGWSAGSLCLSQMRTDIVKS